MNTTTTAVPAVSPENLTDIRLVMLDGTLSVFESRQPDFGMSCSIDVYKDGTAFCDLEMPQTAPGGIAADDIAALAEATGRLRDWLADCATLARWATDNACDLWGEYADRKPVVLHAIDRSELERQGHTRALCGEPFSTGDDCRPTEGTPGGVVVCPACEAAALLHGYRIEPQRTRVVA